ncbi:hypothetical protein BJ322DRAFT_1065110 [Thelephora terrestris]|uniref:Uncharacterized protein n=1 Tax=Thelephora terrestris TaxID=56493 RepID=A0A9P6HD71_9AGAM|nr:hypothetical protein BJ322DRAFT_1088979 [Thelephora terrestris]KAF9780071.1 hypothetical protein BJ322DRAFT_1084432 [Thelephora terrestris]KAF9784578.1 hypothetical protein BJ322DRAFT_1065110 [Thelephora terrestris]
MRNGAKREAKRQESLSANWRVSSSLVRGIVLIILVLLVLLVVLGLWETLNKRAVSCPGTEAIDHEVVIFIFNAAVDPSSSVAIAINVLGAFKCLLDKVASLPFFEGTEICSCGQRNHTGSDRRFPFLVPKCLALEGALPFVFLIEALTELLKDWVSKAAAL